MAHHITELLTLDPDAEHTPSQDLVDLVDLVRLNVPAVATSEEQAVYVLTALGRTHEEAERHVRYCVTGEWRNSHP